MATTFKNVYTHRKVDETKKQKCFISDCWAQTSSVLITPGREDHFYICPKHLDQPARLCNPIIDEAAEAAKKAAEEAKKKAELESEKNQLIAEYKEKQKKKEEKEKEKEKDKDAKDSSKDKDKEKDITDGDKKKDDSTDKDKADKTDNEPTTPKAEEHRIFALTSWLYQDRLLAKRRKSEMAQRNEIAMRNLQRLQDPSAFPSVPQGFR